MAAYEDLKARFRRAGVIDDVFGLLAWDQGTLMADGSADMRAEQTAELRLLVHEILAAPELPELLERADEEVAAREAVAERPGWDRANLTLMRRRHVHAAAVPGDLVIAETKAAARTEMRWRQARAEKDFATLAPHLSELLELVREVAMVKAVALDLDPYDALLDQYEPGGRMADIAPLFDRLGEFLPEFVADVQAHQAAQPAPVPPMGPFPIAAQKRLAERFMAELGFDFERGRLDESHHPFCGGAFGDVRITTRYDEADFTGAMLSTIHETGHALYEAGRPLEWVYQPVGLAGGMALHESQSLAMEMQVARDLPFLTHAAPIIGEIFGTGSDPAWAPDNLRRLFTQVSPGFIRVDADEVTYPAHVILRTRLERAMISGSLRVEDLPGAWNDGMDELLGIVPPDDALGCLQDIHWPSGSFGYFPTYTMGAIAAAQLVATARQAIDDLDHRIARGDLAALTRWLGKNVHERGQVRDTNGILEDATGRGLDLDAFIGHLRARYLN
jgi:carboxypeptidase Taq